MLHEFWKETENKCRFWEKVMFYILGVDRNVIESADRY